jgi:uncharacterized protein with FMN-binding domain
MRRITFTIVTTLAVLVLLFSYRTSRNESVGAKTVAVGQAHVVSPASASSAAAAAGPDPAAPPSSQSPGQVTIPSTSSSAPSSPSRKPTTATPTTTSSTALSVTVDGAAVGTRYGDVQVEVVITAGRITDVNAIAYPDQERRDQQINQDALPQLRSQVLEAQSADIAGVSGATYTTEGYLGSLQSALDQVHFQ